MAALAPVKSKHDSSSSNNNDNSNKNSTERKSCLAAPSSLPLPDARDSSSGTAASPSTTTTTAGEPDRSHYPLHLKKTSLIDYDALLALDSDTEESKERCRHALRFVRDPDTYKHIDATVPRPHIPYTAIPSAHVKKMLEFGVIEPCDKSDCKGATNIFCVPEDAKQRFRPIRHTTTINDTMPDVMPDMRMASKRDLLTLAKRGKYCIAFDAAAYFDQFKLHPEIRKYMCFCKGKKFYRATRMAMGQRQAVETAHTTMQLLTDIPGRCCSCAEIIDNAIFVGDYDDCLHDGIAFAERCDRAGCTLNEDTSSKAAIESLITQSIDWNGGHIDFKHKKVCLTQKILDKIRLSWSLRDAWSNRSFAAHMGLLFYSVGLVVADPGDYIRAIKSFAAVSCQASYLEDPVARDNFWSAPLCELSSSALVDLRAWTQQVLRNVPVRVSDRAEKTRPAWLVAVDSCSIGFGYLAVNPETGDTRTHGQRWPDAFAAKNRHLLHQSVFTEPHGVVMAMCHLLRHDPARPTHQLVHIWSDSVTTVATGNRGYSTRCDSANDCLQRLRRLFPAEFFSFSFSHIAGTLNEVADAASRGRDISFNTIQKGKQHLLETYYGGEAARVAAV